MRLPEEYARLYPVYRPEEMALFSGNLLQPVQDFERFARRHLIGIYGSQLFSKPVRRLGLCRLDLLGCRREKRQIVDDPRGFGARLSLCAAMQHVARPFDGG